MRFVTDILYRLARSHPGGASIDGTEGEIILGTELSPILEVPGPQKDIGGFNTTALQRESFSHFITLTLTPSQAEAISVLCTFARGLWDVHLHVDYMADFSAANTAGGLLELLDEDADIVQLVRTSPAALVPQHVALDVRMLFQVDSWSLQGRIGATGVGQNHQMALSVIANRRL